MATSRQGGGDDPAAAIPSYRATLKPLAVEEPIDLAVHRPLGYLIARASYPTSITPDQLTWLSMFVGVGSAAWIFYAGRAGHSLAPASVLLTLSAVIDCSDGQLARMRRTSSVFGRMLDGAVDAIVQAAVLAAVLALLISRHRAEGPAALAGWVALWAFALWSGSQHTSLYDRYKNLYLRHTLASFNEAEDDDDVEAAWAAAQAGGPTLADRLRFFVYRSYLPAQRRLFAWVDPAVPGRFRDMPAYSPEVAGRYRARCEGLMRAWCWYGIGTHIAALSLALALGGVEVYVVARALLWNGSLLVLIPLQRKASRAFFGGGA
ncbi:MAG: CDP-alcohol phosphatidyltransferase family protein [Polyangiales bacterium]